MFTFGRDHEVQHVLKRFGGEEKADLLVAVVNSVHDLIEGKTSVETTISAIENAFIEGTSGVWEKAGGWLLKVNADYPSSTEVWHRFACHSKANVRFRTAGFLIDFPKDLRKELYFLLRQDKTKKVRDLAEGKWDYCEHPENYS